MAKLSARGRKELLRVSKEKEITNSDVISWEKTTRAFMSDNTVLEKRDVKFLPIYSKGRKHSYGWKRRGKLNEGVTIENVREEYAKTGWKIEK